MTGFWVPKMVPKILQANLIFYVVFATLASQTVLAEKLKVFKKARRDASSPVLTKPPGEWGECYLLFLMENAHCATAGDTEQNGAKHFTVARRAIVTCFRRVMIVFAGICKGKLKIVTCFARQKKFYSLFLWRTKHVTISSFPLQMPAKSIVTRLAHVTNARRATRKCQISLSHKPGTVETVRFPRKMLLEQGWTCEKMPLSWKMHRTHH